MVIRRRISKKDRQYNGQKKKRQTMIYKTLHRKLKIKQYERHLNFQIGGDLMCSRMVRRSCSASGTTLFKTQ